MPDSLQIKQNWFKTIFQKKQIPNWLTIIRMVIVPMIIVLFVLDTWPGKVHGISGFYIPSFNVGNTHYGFTPTFIAAGALFVIASITDLLDGYLARKYNWVSEFGKIWDPIADKVLVNTVLICLTYEGAIPFWITVLFIMRDVIVDAYRMTAIKNKITVAANKWGKYKTIFQMLGITIIFFLFNSTGMLIFTGAHEVYRMTPIEHTWQYWVLQNGIIYVALFFSIFSGIIYIINFSKKNGTN